MTDNNLALRASYHTLGCKLNFSETSEIGKQLARKGILRASGLEQPDICVVNTCSVTETADKKGRQLIRALNRKYPEAKIIVTGCYAQLRPDELAGLPGVALVVGNADKLSLPSFIDSLIDSRLETASAIRHDGSAEGRWPFQGACERGDRTRWWLKVQDGCDYFCTYCTIPFARGRSRSGKTEDLATRAEEAAREGAKEIVLTGVNVGCFGLDTGESFPELLRRLDRTEGIERFRISSIEPNLLTKEIIDWIATESRAFMPHFHIPLQSGSDVVLRLMNRRYDTALFRSRLEYIKERIPDAFIGVDVIAGARGETDAEFEKSLAFIESIPFSRLHVFPYSERPGTKALQLGEAVDQRQKHLRAAELQKLSDRRLHEFMTGFQGTRRPVLWEHPAPDFPEVMHGHTDNYIRISAPVDHSSLNTVSETLLGDFDPSQPETLRAILL